MSHGPKLQAGKGVVHPLLCTETPRRGKRTRFDDKIGRLIATTFDLRMFSASLINKLKAVLAKYGLLSGCGVSLGDNCLA